MLPETQSKRTFVFRKYYENINIYGFCYIFRVHGMV